MRDIKFRGWDKELKLMFELSSISCSPTIAGWIKTPTGFDKCIVDEETGSIMQFTGLLDKNSREIYEGDILRNRIPCRNEQTHYGDNIPNGEYTELLEPIIKQEINDVIFENAMFRLTDEQPLEWLQIEYDLQQAKNGFTGNWTSYKPALCGKWLWDEKEDGDLQYLLAEYKLNSEAELIKYLGVEVIGNIYENPELLADPQPGGEK